MLRKLVRRVSQACHNRYFKLFSNSSLSKKLHGSQYENFLFEIEQKDMLELNTFQYKILTSTLLQEAHANSNNFPLLRTLDNKVLGHFDDICIDIGSGTGWISNLLSIRFDKVIAIEPNANAISISKTFFGTGYKENIEWHCGYAENILREFSRFSSPVFIVSGVVLSHIPNRTVVKILKFINEELPLNSAGLLCEAWGSVRNEKMWHVRSDKWWEKQLSKCELSFYGRERSDSPGEYLGLTFKKIRL